MINLFISKKTFTNSCKAMHAMGYKEGVNDAFTAARAKSSTQGIWPATTANVKFEVSREESYHVVSRCMAMGSPWVPVCADEDLETASRIMGEWIKSNLCDSCEFKIEVF